MSGVNLLNDGPLKKKPGVHDSPRRFFWEGFWPNLFAFLLFSFPALAQSNGSLLASRKPADVPSEWKAAIGDYDSLAGTVVLFERDGALFISGKQFGEIPFEKVGNGKYAAKTGTDFEFKIAATIAPLKEVHGGAIYERNRLDYTPHPGNTAAAKVEALRKIALASAPPEEKGPFRKPALVELVTLDSAIHLDIRYATSNDFLGVPVYTQPRAFLQLPAAEALLRVLHKLQPFGYGLLIHDGYRPWYVTKIFWDATPAEGKIFVADPAQGSRHNRGCAVDLTLYDLKTGQTIEMHGL
jgi:D-alanyl-D-alanine dipeptidase